MSGSGVRGIQNIRTSKKKLSENDQTASTIYYINNQPNL